MKTIACKFLDYDENEYSGDCKISGLGIDKFVWERRDYDGRLQLCQFCSKRGRLNGAESCTSLSDAKCGLYDESEIKIIKRDTANENKELSNRVIIASLIIGLLLLIGSVDSILNYWGM